MADLAVPQSRQVFHRQADPDVIVADDGRDRAVVGVPVDQHHRHLAAAQVFDHLVVASGGGEDEAVHLALQHVLHHVLGMAIPAVGVADEDGVALLHQDRLGSGHDGPEEGVLDVGDDDAHRHGLVGAQPAGQRMGAIAEATGDLGDPVDGVGLDHRGGEGIEGPGGSRHVYPRLPGHVLECRPLAHFVSIYPQPRPDSCQTGPGSPPEMVTVRDGDRRSGADT